MEKYLNEIRQFSLLSVSKKVHYLSPTQLSWGRGVLVSPWMSDLGNHLWIYFILHTHIPWGCRCAFWALLNLTNLNGQPLAIINSNMPDIWQIAADSWTITIKQNVRFLIGICSEIL